MQWSKHKYEGRNAWLMESDRLRLVMLEGGGHVAEIAMAGKRAPGGVNPLWQPPWPTMEPYRFAVERDGPLYGTGREARLLSGIRGHNLCFDYWGPPSDEEWRAGMTVHGEASMVRWKARKWHGPSARAAAAATLKGCATDFTAVAELPLSAARLTRTVRLRAGETAAYFEETAENLTALDRAIGWVQHVSFGPPFIKRGGTLLDMPATHGWSLPEATGRVPSEAEFDWPYVTGADGRQVDLHIAAPEQRSGFVLGLLIDPAREHGFIAAATPRLRLLAAYVFRREQYPWVNHWEEDRSRSHAPWNGQTLAIGLEFGNSVVPGSRRALAAAPPEKWGVPTYGWLPARAAQTTRYIALLAQIPRDYRGTADIRAIAGGFAIFERAGAEGPGRQFQTPCDSSFLD